MNNSNTLPVWIDWQTQQRGELWDEYQIYIAQVKDLGIPIKTFDEWLNS